MKKFLRLLILTLCLLTFGCHHHGHCAEKKLQIVASTFPVYVLAANVTYNIPVDLQLLVPAAAGCPHDFILRPADLAKLAKADVLIINGAGLEAFLTQPLAGLERKPIIIDASEGIDFLKYPHSEAINPHAFASPHWAAVMVNNMAARLSEIDTSNAKGYTRNAGSYVQILDKLCEKLQKIGADAANKGIALEHDALAYLAQNAGLKVVAELEHGASAAQLGRLKKILLETKPALLAGDVQFSDRLLETLAKETNLPYATLDSCASGVANASGTYYEMVMTKNINILERYFDR